MEKDHESLSLTQVQHPEIYGYQILRDPMYMREGLKMDKKSSLFDIKLNANKMLIKGFHKLKMTYIRVIRHFGVTF